MVLRKIVWRIFPPFEVTATANAARAFFNEENPLCRSVIEPTVMAVIKDAEKTVYSVRIDHVKPEHLAFIVMTNILGRHIGSGAYHSYRGRLNQTGQNMSQLWHTIQNRMVVSGFITEAEKAEDNSWLQEQVASAG